MQGEFRFANVIVRLHVGMCLSIYCMYDCVVCLSVCLSLHVLWSFHIVHNRLLTAVAVSMHACMHAHDHAQSPTAAWGLMF